MVRNVQNEIIVKNRK